jgi:hypothetical protein
MSSIQSNHLLFTTCRESGFKYQHYQLQHIAIEFVIETSYNMIGS